MIGVIAKTDFRPTVLQRAQEKADRRFLFKAGAAVRTVAMRSIRTGRGKSAAGMPPKTRRGLLRRAIRFGVEFERRAVLIGPAYSVAGQAGKPHEHGGTYKKQTYPRRPFMGPALEQTQDKLPDVWADAWRRA